MTTLLRLAGIFVGWTIMSSTLFVLLGRLWRQYPPPAMFWQWWHYLWFNYDDPVTLTVLGWSATLPTVLLLIGGMVALVRAHRARAARPLYGETHPATRREMTEGGLVIRRNVR